MTRRTPTEHRPCAADRAAVRVRHGRREPPRHRVQRRRVRLLRDAAVARRLRRDRDRRRAAVGRGRARSGWSASRTRASRSCSSRATRPPHLAAIAPLSVHRRHLRHPVPGRDPQRRLRVELGDRTASTTHSRPASPMGAQTDRRGRHDVRGRPGAPAASRPTVRTDQGRRLGSDNGAPTLAPDTFVDRIDVPVFIAGVVAGRGDGRALRDHARRLRARRTGEGHGDERHPRRFARRPSSSRRGSTSSTSTWPARCRRSRRNSVSSRRRSSERSTGSGASLAARPFRSRRRLRLAARGLRGRARAARAVRRRGR